MTSTAGSCPNCSGDLAGRSCKRICPRCGYFESCSDLEPAMPLSRPNAAASTKKLPTDRPPGQSAD